MDFAEFAARAADVEAEPADLEIVALVTDMFEAAGDDLGIVARFVQGRVFPAWRSQTLDIGPSLCYEAIARAAGRNVSAADVEAELAEVGDIGAVAAGYEFGTQRSLAAFGSGAQSGSEASSGRTVAEVFADLSTLAAAEGSGSQDTKVRRLQKLFNDSSSEEARYLARLVLSEMRIGVGEGTVRDAIAGAFDVPTEDVERALQVSNDYGSVAETARAAGREGLDAMELRVGRPVQAMLAQAGTVADAVAEWERAAVEWKFDGARVQIHYAPEEPSGDARDADGRGEESAVSIFSRNMEDVTDALPEIVEHVETHLDAPAIVDGEVVAVDESGEPRPFQHVLRRFRRKHDVAKAREDVELSLRAFDCLHADGEDLLDEPLTERHERLSELLSAGVSALTVTGDVDEIAAVETRALEAGHEGIMLKDPDSTYSPGRRGKNWLKRKPDVETLDLVVTGAEWGEGRRASFLGTFLLSARTESGYETIGKVATGITDEELSELTDLLEPHVRTQEGRVVEIEPAVVFEVGHEEIQRSPTYSSGYALRFPRFLGVREDKDPADADTLERIEGLR